jgi:hypothetical protein
MTKALLTLVSLAAIIILFALFGQETIDLSTMW